MSEAVAAPIDTAAEVTVPEGDVSREDLVKILEDARAAEPEEAEAATEEPAKDAPKEPSVSSRIIAAKRAEARAAKEQQAIAAVRAEVAKERAEVERARSELTSQTSLVEQLRAAKVSPSKALELLGMSPREFLESLATEHEPSTIAKRVADESTSEVRALKAELEAFKAARAEEAKQQQEQSFRQQFEAATRQFVEFVDNSAEQYPHLVAEMTPAEIAREAQTVATQHSAAYHAKFGVYPDDSVIAEYLESQAKARHEALAERRARVGFGAISPRQGSSDIQGQPSQARPRTLTNGVSAQRGSVAKPWSQADADAESRRLIEQMFSASRDD